MSYFSVLQKVVKSSFFVVALSTFQLSIFSMIDDLKEQVEDHVKTKGE